MYRAAIIDLGTNTFHILIFEWEGIQYKILDKLQIPVKLGKGAFEDLQIKDDAFSRGMAALIEFKTLLASYEVHHVEAYGTSALRNAINAEEFRKEAEIILGHPIQVITGSHEADLIYNGVNHAVPMSDEPHLIMDVGGGSVEFIIANDKHIHWKRSFEIGIARLIEKYHHTDPLNEAAIIALKAHLEDELGIVRIKGEKYQVKTMIGASGSFESIAAIEMQMYHSTPQAFPFVHHIVDLQHFEAIYEKIISTKRENLKYIPGMPDYRAEMMTVAIIMIKYVLKSLGIRKLIVSDYALKEGVMFKIMKEPELNLIKN
jgi:exopolyphosphatase/guanosine-5'-triphosphate,3'-diphosphate pyrophosphatase